MNYVLTFIIALFILTYWTFTAFTIYFVLVSKRTNMTTVVGNVIWYHGVAWVLGMIGVVVVTAAILLTYLLVSTMKLQVLFGV